MTQQSDLDTTKIALIGGLGAILCTVVAMVAIVAYYAVATRVAQARSDEAARRIHRQAEQISAGSPMSQPWLNAELQRATQEAQLSKYARRTIAEVDGMERVVYAMPIEQAMEAVLIDAKNDYSAESHPKEIGP